MVTDDNAYRKQAGKRKGLRVKKMAGMVLWQEWQLGKKGQKFYRKKVISFGWKNMQHFNRKVPFMQ